MSTQNMTFTDREKALSMFQDSCKELSIEKRGMDYSLKSSPQVSMNLEDLVIYEMTDGMRTSTQLNGSEAYLDGANFVLRLTDMLKSLGGNSMYVNVVEEKHITDRNNFSNILNALKKSYKKYANYANENNTRVVILGDYKKTDPTGKFGRRLDELVKGTKDNRTFTSIYLIGYSLEWAMKNKEKLEVLPEVKVVARHTKMQLPTGMMLPPSKSDYSSLMYIQQGSSSMNWSDKQLVDLLTIALRNSLLNKGTQYSKAYKSSRERESIRRNREVKTNAIRKKLDPNIEGRAMPPKRVIITSKVGPEIYEF